MFAEAISLIQNNCTYLNERSEVDFCALTEYTPAQLSAAMRFVNFTGYTGNIQFDPDLALTRLCMQYQRLIADLTHLCFR